MATTGVPRHAASCIGPESFPTSTRIPAAVAARPAISISAPTTGSSNWAALQSSSATASSPGPITINGSRPRASNRVASSPKRQAGQRLVSPRAVDGARPMARSPSTPMLLSAASPSSLTSAGRSGRHQGLAASSPRTARTESASWTWCRLRSTPQGADNRTRAPSPLLPAHQRALSRMRIFPLAALRRVMPISNRRPPSRNFRAEKSGEDLRGLAITLVWEKTADRNRTIGGRVWSTVSPPRLPSISRFRAGIAII